MMHWTDGDAIIDLMLDSDGHVYTVELRAGGETVRTDRFSKYQQAVHCFLQRIAYECAAGAQYPEIIEAYVPDLT